MITPQRINNVLLNFLTGEEIDSMCANGRVRVPERDADHLVAAKIRYGVNNIIRRRMNHALAIVSDGQKGSIDFARLLTDETFEDELEIFYKEQGIESDSFKERIRDINRRYDLSQYQLAKYLVPGFREIHGITRERVAAVLAELDTAKNVGEKETKEDPLMLEEIRNYLKRWSITDRLSYEKVLFGYEDGHRVANWYQNCGIRGLFPVNLVEIVLGRKLGKPLTEYDLTEAGNKLFGSLSSARASLALEIRRLLTARGISTKAGVLKLKDRDIAEIARSSSAGSTTILFRILFRARPRQLYYRDHSRVRLREAIANFLVSKGLIADNAN